MPKVTIVVPVFKVEAYLDRCIHSLVKQTLSNLEIVLVDDGSPDKCPQMCDDWACKDSRIKVVHKVNGGLGMACNSGLEVASGDYVAFCDSDDYVEEDMYESMYNEAVQNQADAVFTGLKSIDENGLVKPMALWKDYLVMDTPEKIHQFMFNMIGCEPSSRLERRVHMSAKVVLYNRAFLKRHSLRFESEREFICEDLLWNLDVLGHASKVISLPKRFYFYYKNHSSLSKSVRTDRFPFYKVIRQELIRRVTAMGLDPQQVKLRTNRMFIGYVRHYIGEICLSDLKESQKRKLVSEICKDFVWKEIWPEYPCHQTPRAHRISAFCMRHNLYYLLKILYKLK